MVSITKTANPVFCIFTNVYILMMGTVSNRSG